MALHPPSEKLSQQMEHEKPRRAAQCGQPGGVIILYVGAYSIQNTTYIKKGPCRNGCTVLACSFRFFFLQLHQLFPKSIDILKLAVHGRKADIRHLIDLLELFHRKLSNARRGHLAVQRIL